VVTRFAPSPTGELHVGGARTALFAWAYARRHGGQYLLRFEDTDQKRSSKQAEENILRDLAWLDLRSDNWGETGETIPRQSQRLELYEAALTRLSAAGCTYEDEGAIRFRMDRPIGFDDAVYNRIEVAADELEDFIIRKADGFPTFHLAVVVDDADMGVTHVIRGQEHLSNTAKHAALYDALGHDRPVWCHTPSILNPDGSKMSKRDKDKATAAGKPVPEINVADFRNSGYLPAVLLNYLALLGWNPGHDLERFDLNYLAQHFDFDRIGKSNSKFDREKLAAFQQDTILQMTPEVWVQTLRPFFGQHYPTYVQTLGDHFGLFAEAYRERSKTLRDPAELGRFFFEAPTEYQPKAVKKHLTKNDGEGLAALAKVREALVQIDPWRAEVIHARLDALWQELGMKHMGGVAQPLRVALTGVAVSPEIGPTLQILGRDETFARIDRCLAEVKT
jgi:glutamyl-tRNA synthetase